MTQPQPCLLRIGGNIKKYRCFLLQEDQVIVGRSPDSTYTIASTVISRCHAILQRQNDNSWTITDNNSVNGVAVNETRLKPAAPQVLQDGDIVMLGVPEAPGERSEFVYRFFSSLKVRKESHKKRKRQHAVHEKTKRQRGDETCSACVPHNIRCDVEKNGSGETDVIQLYEERLCALAAQLKEREAEKCAIQQQLQVEREQRHAIEQVHREQEEKVHALDAKQRQLEEEKAAVEQQMQQQLELKLQEQEECLRRHMQQQLASLAEEKKQVEEHLQMEMEKAVLEKDKELHVKLQGEKERLQKVIETKELEQKALESQLAESRLESEQARTDTLKAREAILAGFADTMETELQCSICSELFIQATSLNCSHAFCALCIRQWLARKKECPVCRSAVTSQVRSYVLDNYIDCMVEQLSDDMKKRRKDLVLERAESQAKLDEAENKQKAGPSGVVVGVQGRNRRGRGARGPNRGRAQTRQGRMTVATTTTTTTTTNTTAAVGTTATITHDSVDADAVNPLAAEPIVVSDADSADSNGDNNFFSVWDRYDSLDQYHSFSDSEEDSDGDYVRGNRGAYYGGYGRCFKCGSRGHWANGCPL